MAVVLGLQVLLALTTLCLGVLSLAAARRVGGTSLQTSAWLVTGVAFTLEGISGTLQSTSAVWAVVAGEGSSVYAAYLRWSTVGNHGRSVLKIGLGLALICLPLTRNVAPRRLPLAVTVWLILFMGLGGLLGWSEGAIQARHFSRVALLDTAEMLVTWGALFIALFTGAIDRLLWVALAVNGFRQALNVIWTSAMAWLDTPGAWVPSSREMQVYACASLLIMVVLAFRRLHLAENGVPVSGLLDLEARPRSSMLG